MITREGEAAIFQYAEGGRLVLFEGLARRVEHPPKRRTVKYLGPSFAAVLAAARERAELRRMQLLYGDLSEGAVTSWTRPRRSTDG